MKKTIVALITAVIFAAGMLPAAFAGETGSIDSSTIRKACTPEKIKIKEINYKTVKISWSSAGKSVKYDLYRYNNKKKRYCLLASDIGKTSYIYRNMKTGLVYKFRVKAVETVSNVDFVSDFSDAAKIKTGFEKPAVVKVTNTTVDKALIKWSKVKGVKGYCIYRYVKSKDKYVRVGKTSSKKCSFLDTGLTAASVYRYKVRGFSKIRKYCGEKYRVLTVPGKLSRYEKAKTKKYRKKMLCKITAYCDRGYTASGLKAGMGRVAVDKSVIPLRSRMYVSGYGECVAADTGGAVKGNYVDIWLPTDAKCRNWGVRYKMVYIR